MLPWWGITLIIAGVVIIVGIILFVVLTRPSLKSRIFNAFTEYPEQCLMCKTPRGDLTPLGLFYDAKDCQTQCNNTPDCVGYTWISGDEPSDYKYSCWKFTNKDAQLTPYPHAYSGYKN